MHLRLGHHSPRAIRGLLAVAIVLTVISVPRALGLGPTTLYVDRSNAACSDTGSGTPTQPFCTIRAAANKVSAGQTVQVAAGTYSESVNIPASGTSGAPILYKAAPGATVTIPNQVERLRHLGQELDHGDRVHDHELERRRNQRPGLVERDHLQQSRELLGSASERKSSAQGSSSETRRTLWSSATRLTTTATRASH